MITKHTPYKITPKRSSSEAYALLKRTPYVCNLTNGQVGVLRYAEVSQQTPVTESSTQWNIRRRREIIRNKKKG